MLTSKPNVHLGTIYMVSSRYLTALNEADRVVPAKTGRPFVACRVKNSVYLVPLTTSTSYFDKENPRKPIFNESGNIIGSYLFNSMIPFLASEVTECHSLNNQEILDVVKKDFQTNGDALSSIATELYNKLTDDRVYAQRLMSKGALADFEKLERVAISFEKNILGLEGATSKQDEKPKEVYESKMGSLGGKKGMRRMTKRS